MPVCFYQSSTTAPPAPGPRAGARRAGRPLRGTPPLAPTELVHSGWRPLRLSAGACHWRRLPGRVVARTVTRTPAGPPPGAGRGLAPPTGTGSGSPMAAAARAPAKVRCQWRAPRPGCQNTESGCSRARGAPVRSVPTAAFDWALNSGFSYSEKLSWHSSTGLPVSKSVYSPVISNSSSELLFGTSSSSSNDEESG